MKVTREQAGQNRERVLEVAGKLFRERGFDGVGVADLMKAAGLTHGAFYGQFDSKEDLMAQATARASEQTLSYWKDMVDRAPGDALARLTQAYLSPQHRDRPGEGCVMAALGAEAPRQGPALRRAVTEGTRALIGLLAGLMPGRGPLVKRERAVAGLAAMVGALVLARAVDDKALSDEILQTVTRSVCKPH